MWWLVALVGVALLIAAYVGWTASRVDRLHIRAAAASTALDAALVRRAAAAAAVEPNAAKVAQLHTAAAAALAARRPDRESAENALTQVLRQIPSDPQAPIVVTSRRVAVARQVHTDAVRDARAVRRRVWVRLFRLARDHEEPEYFDVADPELRAQDPTP